VPVNNSEILDGKKSTLGQWLAQIRGYKTNPRWAQSPLNVMGMRYETGAPSAGLPSADRVDMADLADLVRAADNARLSGDEAGLAISSERT
jgi:hypothetical protein